MRFTDIFIKRPVFATVLSLILLLVGIVGYNNLAVRQYPKIDSSVITVTTSYPGANAQLMEGYVTTPIENSIAGVDGIDYMTSTSAQGLSTITINLKLGYDIDKAINDVGNSVSSVRAQLPKDIYDPVIAKNDPNSNPTLFLSFASNKMSPQDITDYLLRVVQPQIQTQNGVGQAVMFGERKYAMRIWLNPQLMAARGVTASDVTQALNANNVQAPAGQLESKYELLNIVALTDLANPKQFNNLIIKNVNGRIVRLQDIGRAELGAQDDNVSVIIDDKPQVVIGIIPKSDANPLDVSKEIYRLLPKLQQQMPAGMQIHVAWDASIFIASSIHEVIHTMLLAALCVVAVIFLFIGSVRSVLIPVITIPLSLIGAMALMNALNYSVNTLTLLAFVLAIGMVVDDAIVVLENIHRHIELGMTPLNAALTGAREISFAVIGMTLTLAAVYAPIGFMAGLTGALFREFAFTLAGTVIISGLIALTLSPMMCSKIMRPVHAGGGFIHYIDNLFQKLAARYQALLTWVLNFKSLILLSVTLLVIFGILVFNVLALQQELAPAEDQGALMVMMFGPSQANINYTQKSSAQLIDIFKKVPEMRGYGIINGFPMGVHSAMSFLVFKPWGERKRSSEDIKKSLFPALWSIPGVMAMPTDPSDMPGSHGFFPVQYQINTTGSYEQLSKSVDAFMLEAAKNPALMNLQSDLKFDLPQVQIKIDRDKASQLGITMQAISDSLNILLSQGTVTYFMRNGRNYQVIPQLMAIYQHNPERLNTIYVRTASGGLTPLSNILQITTLPSPSSLNHFQQMRSASITAIPFPGYSLGQAYNYLNAVAKKVLPDAMQTDVGGDLRQFVDASGAMTNTFICALLFIFLVLAAQFESFIDPLIVMVSVPLSLVGALAAMLFTGSTLNIYTEIGLVTLIGLISKHGILMVEFANQLQQEGREKTAAIIEAARIRLRPILMTTAAMVLGAIPLALAGGAGSNARRQMGWVIIGGMAVGTIFTLLVIPVIYCLLSRKKKAVAAAKTITDEPAVIT